MSPAEFPRRILLAVTGMSPQVVTETLHALIFDQGFVPTEIRLITTEHGFNRAMRDLLDPHDGKFIAFCKEYGLEGRIRFDESCIKVICDRAGNRLPDIRTPEENACAADEIVRVVQHLCRDEEAALHVSIAGGRKSMGFFVGYALSLFARPQDRLSHVLVSEPFENNRDFFYPSKGPKKLVAADGRTLDASEARVMLADIPLVRLRAGLSQELLYGQTSYSIAVSAAQANIEPEISLAFNVPAREILCGGRPIRLPPMQLALMLWFARLRQKGRAVRPGTDAHAQEFLDVYREVVGPWSGDYENAVRAFAGKDDFLPRFQELRARLKSKLRQELGPFAGPYLIETEGKRTQTRYRLCLPAERIHIGSIEDGV